MRCEMYAYLKGPVDKSKFHIISFRRCEYFYPATRVLQAGKLNISIVLKILPVPKPHQIPWINSNKGGINH